MSKDFCENCKWFWIDSGKPSLECHRYAPRIFCGSGEGWSGQKWPEVNYTDFCGEFIAKENQNE